MAQDEIVVLGKIADAYGLQGWLRIHPFGDDPASWARVDVWWLRDERASTGWTAYRLEDCKPRGDSIVVRFEGVGDRTSAEGLKGQLIGVLRSELPATKNDEYYWDDLIGLEVVNADGQCLGRIAGLIETGANAVMQVVDDAGRERLLPFVSAVVSAVDLAGRKVRVDWGVDW